MTYISNCTQLNTTSLLDLHSQDALKDGPGMLTCTPPSTFSSTLLGMLSEMLQNALDGTLPACLTVHSQVSSQDALKHISNISKMYFSLWQPPEVSESMWSVNLEWSISGEYQTVRGHSGLPLE
jgi:hypothetical protein